MEPDLKDAGWYERMYDNRARVPDSASYMGRWAERSARVRASQACVLDVAYGAEPSETLDIFLPAAGRVAPMAAGASLASKPPVMVFIHGGYWRALDKSDHSFLAPAFTSAGCLVVVVNYALCPGVRTAPSSIALIGDQVERALQWVSEHIGEHGGDATRISVTGHSAGGQLAALMLATPWQVRSPRLSASLVRSALSISGLHDLEPIMRTPSLQSSVQLTAEQVQRCSPCFLPPPAQGTLLCAVGGDESAEFLRQNQLMQQAWGVARVPQAVEIPGLNHFSVLETLAEPGQPLHAMALGLLTASE